MVLGITNIFLDFEAGNEECIDITMMWKLFRVVRTAPIITNDTTEDR